MFEECLRVPATRAVCVREYQKSIAQSSKFLIQTKIDSLGVGGMFDVTKPERSKGLISRAASLKRKRKDALAMSQPTRSCHYEPFLTLEVQGLELTQWPYGSFSGPAEKYVYSTISRAWVRCWPTTSTKYVVEATKRPFAFSRTTD